MKTAATGTVVKIFEPVTGNGQKGPWTKQTIAIQVSQYEIIYPDLWNSENIPIEGEQITAELDLKGKEYNGRFYHELRLIGWTKEIGQATTQQPQGMWHKQSKTQQEKDNLENIHLLYQKTEKEKQVKIESQPDPINDLPF